jgi:hypothetical protein
MSAKCQKRTLARLIRSPHRRGQALLSSLGGEIESKDAFVIVGPFQHFGVPKRAAGIVVARITGRTDWDSARKKGSAISFRRCQAAGASLMAPS